MTSTDNHTPPSRTITKLDMVTSPIAGACLLLFLIAGLFTNGYAVLVDHLSLITTTPSWSTFMNGAVMQNIAHSLADTPMPSNAAKFERGLSWIAVGDLGARVREGDPNWLFYNAELEPNPNNKDDAATRANKVIEINKGLLHQNIKLLVVIVPDKSRIEQNHLGTLHRSKLFSDRIDNWIQSISASGVNTIDLTPDFLAYKSQGGDSYFRTDSHWNEQGAEIAASVIAQRIKVLNIQPQPLQASEINNRSQVARPGDLVRVAGLDWLPEKLQPTPETVQLSSFKVIEAHSPSSPNTNLSDDLFGDANLPNIVLLGTSFSRNSNFLSFLEHYLGVKVANFAMDGGEFYGAARDYFNSPSFKETPPKLIIWEIPERSIESKISYDKLK